MHSSFIRQECIEFHDGNKRASYWKHWFEFEWVRYTNNNHTTFSPHIHSVCLVNDYSWETSWDQLSTAHEEYSAFSSSHTIIRHCHYQFSSNCYTPMWHTTTSGGKLLTCWIMYRVDRPTDTYERGFFHCLWWFATS